MLSDRKRSRRRKVSVKAGVEVYCLQRHRIGKILRPIKGERGIRFSGKHFRFEPGQERLPGEKAACKICGFEYMPEGYDNGADGFKLKKPKPIKNPRPQGNP